MKPIVKNEPGWVTFKGPESMGDDCGDISAVTGMDDRGYRFVATVWEPTQEELELVRQGKEVILLVKVIGTSLPPMALELIEKEPESTIQP